MCQRRLTALAMVCDSTESVHLNMGILFPVGVHIAGGVAQLREALPGHSCSVCHLCSFHCKLLRQACHEGLGSMVACKWPSAHLPIASQAGVSCPLTVWALLGDWPAQLC